MLLLIPVLLPVISGTILLIKTWKKKPWRRPRFILISALINSAVVLGFLIAQYSEAVNVSIAGSVAFRLERDGLGDILAGCMAVLMPAILCYFSDLGEKRENRRKKADMEKKSAEVRKTDGKRDVISALLNYLFATVTGIAFSKNAATMGFFLILFLLIAAVIVWRNHDPGKWYWIIFGIGAVAVLSVLAVAVFGGNGAVFYFDGYLTGNISEQMLRFLYVLGFCGCSVRVLVYPFFAGQKREDIEKTSRLKEKNTQDTHMKDSQYRQTGEFWHEEKRGDARKTENRWKNRETVMTAENLLSDIIFAFLLIRLTFSVFGVSLLRGTWAQVVVTLIAVVGVLAHSVSALRERTLQKKLPHLYGASFSLFLTGISVMTSHGYAAAVWLMVAFASVQMLFIFFREALREKEISGDEHMSGLGRQMPVTFGCYVVAGLGLCAVPPLAGYLSAWKLAKAFTRQGGLNYLSMAALFTFLFLAAVSLYPTVIRAFFPKNEPVVAEKVDEAGLQMLVPMVVLAAVVIALGFFSGPLGEYIYQIGLGLS